MAQMDPAQDPTRSIRRRLQILVLRAFATVVLLTVVLMIGSTFLVVSLPLESNPFYQSPGVQAFQTYYQVHGGWDDVLLFSQEPLPAPLRWDELLLLDAGGRVLIDRGQVDTPLVGQPYTAVLGEFRLPLVVDDQPVGALVLGFGAVTHPWRLLLRMLYPLFFVSALLGLLALLIGMLLIRRVVNPLAEVIAAAQAVAAGDLTARVPVHGPHDDLYALSDHFKYMAAELERSDRERRNLLADVTHELRTPLTVLRGRLEGILDGVYPPDDAHIAPALEETYLLERLVDDLRLLALAETRQLRFEPQRFDLGELAGHAAGLFQAQAAEQGLALAVEIEADLPPVCADRQRIEQVIGNLLGNALRYTPAGGQVLLRVALDRSAVLSPPDAGQRVVLSVADSGPGVAPAELSTIFDRFWRGEKSRSRQTGGAGLGLAIARQLVIAQGGGIEARNRTEGGLEVRFWLEAKAAV